MKCQMTTTQGKVRKGWKQTKTKVIEGPSGSGGTHHSHTPTRDDDGAATAAIAKLRHAAFQTTYRLGRKTHCSLVSL